MKRLILTAVCLMMAVAMVLSACAPATPAAPADDAADAADDAADVADDAADMDDDEDMDEPDADEPQLAETGSVVIASKPMTEQYILVEMLTMLIEANTEIEVEQKLGIGGGTANIHPGMISGEIDIYPEYTGTGWLSVLKQDLINDPQALFEAVKASYLTEYDIVWSELYGFNNGYELMVTEAFAQDTGVKTYSDLAAISADYVFGAEYDFFEREDGYSGLVETYGFEFKDTAEMDIGLKYAAMDQGQVDVLDIFTTDARLLEGSYMLLEDDKNYFATYHCATLIRSETLAEYPELAAVLAMLDGRISDEEMTFMNYLVEIEHEDPKAVARDFLQEKDLL